MGVKFRAWHKPTQLMDDVVLIDFYNEKIGILYADPVMQCESMQKYNFNEVELMQSTGLKDKSGKEIYEGDIIDVGTRIPFLNKIQKDEETNYLKLVPIDERWTESYFTSFEDKSRFEILGNIYENPELLEVE